MKSIQQTYFCGGKERNLATIHGRTNQNDKKSLQMLIHTDKLNIFSSVFRQSQKIMDFQHGNQTHICSYQKLNIKMNCQRWKRDWSFQRILELILNEVTKLSLKIWSAFGQLVHSFSELLFYFINRLKFHNKRSTRI